MTDASSVNADAHELARFSSLAHEWWDLEGPFKALHQINPLRLEWISQFQSLSGLDVLDVGCGGGILTDAMARKGAQATGIDLANASIQVAQLHALDAQTPNVKYLCMSAEALAEQAPASFDVVTCMEMLEHVPHPESIIQACSRLVKPQGWVFFSTLNRHWTSFFKAIIGAEYVLGMVPKGTHEYAKFIRPSELVLCAERCGLQAVQLKGLEYHPFKRIFSLSDNVDVNYLLAAQRLA